MAPREVECPHCQGTGRITVPIGTALSASTLAVLMARYDPATGAIMRRWADVATVCDEPIERVRMRHAQATLLLWRWQRAAKDGLPLADDAAAALATWQAVLDTGSLHGRYRPGAVP